MRKYLFIALFFSSLLDPISEGLARFSNRWQNFFSNSEKKDSVQIVPPNYLPLLTRETSVRNPRETVWIRESFPTADNNNDGKDNPAKALPKPQVGTIDSHNIKPYEVSANRNASKYFRNYYQVDWSQYEKDYPTKL